MSPPDAATTHFVEDKRKLTAAFAQAVKDAAVPHVVLLSSIGAQHPDGTGPIAGLHDIEAALAATGAATTFVRPAYFVDNWAPVLPAAKGDGVLPSFLPEGLAIPMVTAKDIGVVIADALLAGPRGRRIIELAGPKEVSPGDIAPAAARVLGRPVTVQEAPLDAVVPTFTSFGFSRELATLYARCTRASCRAASPWEGGDAEFVNGSTSIEDTLRPLLA